MSVMEYDISCTHKCEGQGSIVHNDKSKNE